MKFKLEGVVSKYVCSESEKYVMISGNLIIKVKEGDKEVEKNIWVSENGQYSILLPKDEVIGIDNMQAMPVCVGCKETFWIEVDFDNAGKAIDRAINKAKNATKMLELSIVEFTNE